jgi:uncharacterized cysteine cluster protein YcgN (CxxCxxCC family)
MTIHEFVCAVCGQPCLTHTTEAEANRELLESGMPMSENTTLHSVCDRCYTAVMTKAREQGLLE